MWTLCVTCSLEMESLQSSYPRIEFILQSYAHRSGSAGETQGKYMGRRRERAGGSTSRRSWDRELPPVVDIRRCRNVGL